MATNTALDGEREGMEQRGGTVNHHITPPLSNLFVLFIPWIDGTSLFPRPGQPWLNLDFLLSLVLLSGIVFHQPLVLLSFFQSFYVFISP